MWQPQPGIIYLGSKRIWLYTSLFRPSKMLLYQRAQRLHILSLGNNWSRKTSGNTIKNSKKKENPNKQNTNQIEQTKATKQFKRKKSTCSLSAWPRLKRQPTFQKTFIKHNSELAELFAQCARGDSLQIWWKMSSWVCKCPTITKKPLLDSTVAIYAYKIIINFIFQSPKTFIPKRKSHVWYTLGHHPMQKKFHVNFSCTLNLKIPYMNSPAHQKNADLI